MNVRRSFGGISVATVVALAASIASPWAAIAQDLPLSAPWNGEPISAGLGPTYGEEWCAPPAPGTSIANQQGSPLALIPQEAVGCTLEKIAQEAAAKDLPQRMEHFVIGESAGGRDVYGVVVNALETAEQRRDFERWQAIRAIELEDPAAAQALLASYGDDVKMPVFVQGNIHGNEEEGLDAMMQVLRDLVTLPRGANPIVDDILDHVILIVVPMENPDGRLAGSRANGNGFDMNRDWLVQSQPEVRASAKVQQEWLATAGLDMHGYVSPTLVDGLTKPHNPGIEYDLFLKWNQPRLDANTTALGGVGMAIQRPVNMWNQLGLPPGHPYVAEGWDDWGPFYTQTYMAFYGVDSSTVEMCSSPAGGACDGRLGSKISQYLTFYSSLRLWIDNRQEMMHDQLEIFRRGVEGRPRPACCAEPTLTARGFTEDQHHWMVESAEAYVIPFGEGQRSDGEANRMVRWLLDNGVRVTRATEDFTWDGAAYRAGTYVVPMRQALRGLAQTALSAGQDISDRILRLYAPPGAWSHGSLWGADVVEVPAGEAFAPTTEPIVEPNDLAGGIVGGIEAPADWYAVTLGGVSDHRAIFDLLRSGVGGEVAEEAFETVTGGAMPAGSLIFDPAAAEALDAAAGAAGLSVERGAGAKLAATRAAEAPRVAILVNSANPSANDTSESLEAIFGSDAAFVSVSSGSDSLQNAEGDPLAGFDVIYNAGQSWPSNATARERLLGFFARGGGYIATSQSTNNFSFLNGSGLVSGSLTQSSQTAYGGIARWVNVGGADSPLTGAYPAEDNLYLPSNVTYFTATPAGSVVDGRYHEDMTGAAPNGPSAGFLAGLWRTRGAAANGAPVIVHGETSAGSRYLAFATNPFSRQDAEREWALIAQAALWSNLTDDGPAVTEGAAGTTGFSLPAGMPTGSTELPAMAGAWEGAWDSAGGVRGALELQWTQQGPSLAGTLIAPGSSCLRGGRITGELDGPELRFSAGAATFTGTVEGGTVTGSFTGGCTGDGGTWEIAKDDTRAHD